MLALRASTFFLLLASSYSWTTIAPSRAALSQQHASSLWMAKKKSGKGFGAAPEPSPSKKESVAVPAKDDPAAPASTPVVSEVASTPDISINMGQRALENMRREQAEKRDTELRKVKQVRETDDFVREVPDAAAIPEKVAMRMGKRMLPFVGIPLFGGMGAFITFWYLATYQDQEFQPALVAITTIVLLAVGLVGITYSMMSASWDADREGSALGFDEFGRNVQNLKDGLSRSKENALVRERMAGLPEAEIQKAISDLDKRDESRKKKAEQQTLQSKLDS